VLECDTFLVHPRLCSLNLPIAFPRTFLEAINLPSLAEWKHRGLVPVAAMPPLLERSGCCLNVLTLDSIPPPAEDLDILPHSSDLLCFSKGIKNTALIYDMFTCIFHIMPGSRITTPKPFLRHLQVKGCQPYNNKLVAPFSWDRIPQHYSQGYTGDA